MHYINLLKLIHQLILCLNKISTPKTLIWNQENLYYPKSGSSVEFMYSAFAAVQSDMFCRRCLYFDSTRGRRVFLRM